METKQEDDAEKETDEADPFPLAAWLEKLQKGQDRRRRAVMVLSLVVIALFGSHLTPV